MAWLAIRKTAALSKKISKSLCMHSAIRSSSLKRSVLIPIPKRRLMSVFARQPEPRENPIAIRYYTLSTGKGGNDNGQDDDDNNEFSPLLHVAKVELERLKTQKFQGMISKESLHNQIKAIRSLLPLAYEMDPAKLLVSVNTMEFLEAFDLQKLMLEQDENKDNHHDNNEPNIKLERFHVLLDAMATTIQDDEVGERAEVLLDHLEALDKVAKLDRRLTTETYNSVLLICAKCGDAKRAQEILSRLLQQFQDNNDNIHVQPNLQSFSYTIGAWSNSKHAEADVRMKLLESQMKSFLNFDKTN